MKIKPDSICSSGWRRAHSRGMGIFDALLWIVAAYFVVTAGISWVEDLRNQRLTHAKLHEIAERVVNLAETAELAGVDLTVGGDVKATVERISRGGVAEYGAFRGQFFGMPELTGKKKEAVARHLEFQFGRLAVAPLESFASAD